MKLDTLEKCIKELFKYNVILSESTRADLD